MLTKEKMENSRLPNISPENRADHPMNGVLIFMEISRSMRTTFFSWCADMFCFKVAWDFCE